MTQPLRIGLTHERTFTVGETHGIAVPGGNVPPMLSTPALILELELTARDAIAALLPDGRASLGTHVDVAHLAATPLGQRVTCRARVVHVDGPSVTFAVEARDEVELIGKGLHRRRVVDVARLAARLAKKARA